MCLYQKKRHPKGCLNNDKEVVAATEEVVEEKKEEETVNAESADISDTATK